MWLSGREFTPGLMERIAAAGREEPAPSLRAMSRQVCEWMDWRGPSGKLAEVSCRKALLELERRSLVTLPERQVPKSLARGPSRKSEPPPTAWVQCSLQELGEVELVLVSNRWCKASETWNALLGHHHPLGAGPLCGDQLRYLVRSPTQGLLGGLSFSAASRSLKERDQWIGWSERARRANLSKVVCNSRFLIPPGVVVPHLASHVLGRALGRLRQDWRQRYGYEPVLVETMVDRERHAGTCYRAANWEQVGQTDGRRRGFANGKRSSGKKDILVYPLRRGWKARLCREPPERLVARTPGGGGWVEDEFAGARVHNAGQRRRLYTLAEDFFAQPLAQIPQACSGSDAKVRAAYRFFKNERIDMKSLLAGHVEATAHRVQQHQVVLAVQDTTTINHNAHPLTEGLGPINTAKDGAVGLVLHDTMAFTLEGTPLGVLDAQCWARDKVDSEKTKNRKGRPIEEKESFKWLRSYRAVAEVQRLCPETMLVSVGDRESDLHELFAEQAGTENGPKLLVRADRGRKRKVQQSEDATAKEEHDFLWARMAQEPVAGTLDLLIPRQRRRPAREARLEVRFAQVALKPPKDTRLEPVSLWAVYATEVDAPPEVDEPIEWMLLTTVEVPGFDQAVERLRWYSLRWGIEVFHRVLKSGCRIEEHQLQAVDRLENCLALDLVVAWRVFFLTKLGRETPDVPCDVLLEETEWKVLCAGATQKPPPPTPPSLRDAVRMIAKLGGFRGRKCDGEPGITTIWRGLDRLDGMVAGYGTALLISQQSQPP